MDLSETNSLLTVHRHPWEISRFDSIFSAFLSDAPESVLDFGAGDVYVGSEIVQRTHANVSCVDAYFPTEEAAPRLKKFRSLESLDGVYFPKIIALDVLEHIEDDKRAFDALLQHLRPGGELIVTVPAHQFLFSDHDVRLKHFRRYSYRALRRLAEHPYIVDVEIFYFYQTLFWARLMGVLRDRLVGNNSATEARIADWAFPKSHWVTRFVVAVLNTDFWVSRFLGRCGIRLPGLSLAMRCQKKQEFPAVDRGRGDAAPRSHE